MKTERYEWKYFILCS